ncbi:enoyl-CoA hydratase/isomerase family protein [Novosphingobium colocasiae]
MGAWRKILNDPFDYEAEDKFVEEYSRALESLSAYSWDDKPSIHPYAHPKKSWAKRIVTVVDQRPRRNYSEIGIGSEMSEILIERRDGGAFVTFNRPESRNALNTNMVDAIAALIASIDDDPEVRYLVFQGAGGHFSAGGDMEAFGQSLQLSSDERRASFEGRIRHNGKCFLLLEALQKPVISLVRGAAAGAGLSFVLASDFVFAAEDAMFIFAQPRVGLSLDLSLTYHLPALSVRRSRGS